MKNTLLIVLTLLFNIGFVMAQQPVAPIEDSTIDHNTCSILITGNFDSECIYDFKDSIHDEYPNLMIACKHSTVTYTAYANTGSASVVDYIWEVYGDISHSASGSQLTVDWSDDEWGMVIVSVVNSEGDTCTEFSRVKLIDNPTVGSTTVPAYTVMPDGRKVIRVCKGASIQFIDQSSAGNSDIAGYQWKCKQAIPSSTPNYFIEDVYMDDKVTHRVYNNCGCYDEEVIEIELLEGTSLELECYGAVCENAIVTYHASAPPCNEYHWYVEGGTIIDGQGTKYPVVQWDNPVDGYGVIGLDGVLCGDIACPTMMSQKIPVVQDHLSIEGQSDVCVGEAVLFSLPMLGSTEYNWSITPTTGVDTYLMTHSNEIRLVFNQAGTYQLRCTYRCDFLDCGPYDAEPLTIVVRPQFDITGNNQVCVSNACDLQTSPIVNASWVAYDLSNGNQVEASASGTSFSHTFSHPGRFLVTAEHPSYCGPATFVLTVKDVPPAPTMADLDPNNRHFACPDQGIALSGTPSEPNYSLVWEPACSSASPQQYSGDSVTISYQSEICDIRVYNYDRVLQCQSSDYYVHQVDELVPASLNIPANITVCPNSLIVWGDNEIPDQSDVGMLYEWTIQDNKQYCASVQGSHLSNSVTWAVNNIAPTTFYVKLTRTYCGGSVDTIINITVNGPIQHSLSINGPDTVCLNTSATFIGSGGIVSTYRWEIENSAYSGNPVSHTFRHEGLQHVLLYENPYTYCTNKDYLNSASHSVMVNPLPMVQGLTYDSQTNTIHVVPSPSPSSYTFSWVFRANAQSPDIPLIGNTDHITPSSFGTYSCTVTDTITGCVKTVSLFYQGNFPGIQCDPMPLTGNYDYCSHSITLSAGHYNPFVTWHVSGGDYSIHKYGTGNRYADITFNNIGIYTVSATSGIANCYSGSRVITVNFIPEFSFKPACNRIEITNTSQYALPGENVYITVTNSCNDDEYTITMPASQTSYTYTPTGSIYAPCTYTFMLTGYGTNGNISQPCSLAVVTIGSPLLPMGVNPVTISTANPYLASNTCDNTPIELTATLGYSGNIVSSTWNFGDASSYYIEDNSISHTFKSPGSYNVSVTIVDNRGCTKTSAPINIISNPNTLSNGQLDILGSEDCPFVGTRDIQFSVNNLHYWWWSHKNPTQMPYTNPYPTHKPDDYFVFAVNDNYCQKEASIFVKFKNAPTAFIYAENFNCCVGNEITLYGEQGPGSDPLSYSWTITGPGGFSQTSSDPNVVFTAPSAGTFNVSLTITNTVSTCSSTATETITVNNRPSAPSIAFVGSPCISNAPVNLQATGYTGEVHWSNGNTGPNARYFTHGLASAYYDDPSVGCPSASDTIRIHKQPDFDALLTGCYEKCKYFFTYNLPVYGLTDDMQSISWDWHLEGSSIATGSGNYTFSPVQLPIPASGNYQMFVSYSNNNCNAASPLLKIDSKETCDCDSIEITYKRQMHLKDCHLSYTVIVTVCNNSSTQNFCFDEIFLDGYAHEFVQLDRTHLDSMTIPPLGCDTFHISIDVLSLIPSAVNLKIIDDTCSNCEKEFSIDLKPEKIECEMEMHLDDYSIIPEFSSNVAAYFDFHMNVHPCQNLLAFWTEPPMVVDYWYDGTDYVHGLGMVDYATLTQLMGEEGKICFYAITCVGNKICKRVYCITAREIYERLRAMGINPKNAVNDNGGSTKQSSGPDLGSNTDLRLMPNPTTGEVNVIGTADEVVEVLVMDMNGRKMATFDNTSTFDVSTLSSGVYIVRVKTKHDNTETVTYLKLVKR